MLYNALPPVALTKKPPQTLTDKWGSLNKGISNAGGGEGLWSGVKIQFQLFLLQGTTDIWRKDPVLIVSSFLSCSPATTSAEEGLGSFLWIPAPHFKG